MKTALAALGAALALAIYVTLANSEAYDQGPPGISIAQPSAEVLGQRPEPTARVGGGVPGSTVERVASVVAPGTTQEPGQHSEQSPESADDPEERCALLVAHYKEALDTWSQQPVSELMYMKDVAEKAVRTRKAEIRDGLIESGMCLTLPFNTEVERHMVPAAKGPRPVQQMTKAVRTAGGDHVEHHVFIDPHDYSDLVLLQNEAGAIAVALEKKLETSGDE